MSEGSRKVRLRSMVKTGGKKAQVRKAEKEKESIFKKHLKFEQELFALKKDTLNELKNTKSMYGSLVLDLEANIKRRLAEIRSLLEESKKIIRSLRFLKSRKRVIKNAIEFGFKKSHIEILKRENQTDLIQIESYRRMAETAKEEVKSISVQIDKIKKSIETKQKALEDDTQ